MLTNEIKKTPLNQLIEIIVWILYTRQFILNHYLKSSIYIFLLQNYVNIFKTLLVHITAKFKPGQNTVCLFFVMS